MRSFAIQHPEAHSDTVLLSHWEKHTAPEAFLNHPGLALHMARFPEAERRRLHKMICMRFLTRDE